MVPAKHARRHRKPNTLQISYEWYAPLPFSRLYRSQAQEIMHHLVRAAAPFSKYGPRKLLLYEQITMRSSRKVINYRMAESSKNLTAQKASRMCMW